MHNSAGIVEQPSHLEANLGGHKQVRCFKQLPWKDLKEVHIGLFDQFLRLTGKSEDQVFSLVTRNNDTTELLIKAIMSVLTVSLTPSPDPGGTIENDIYRMFNRSVSQGRGGGIHEFVHPSKVKFVYPSEDDISELVYFLRDNIRGQKPPKEAAHLLFYLLCFVRIQDGDGEEYLQPHTIVITESHLGIALEDKVSYPFPSFARKLPQSTHFNFLHVHRLDILKRIRVTLLLALIYTHFRWFYLQRLSISILLRLDPMFKVTRLDLGIC